MMNRLTSCDVPGDPGHVAGIAEAKREIELLNHKMALKDVLMDLKLPQTGGNRAKKK